MQHHYYFNKCLFNHLATKSKRRVVTKLLLRSQCFHLLLIANEVCFASLHTRDLLTSSVAGCEVLEMLDRLKLSCYRDLFIKERITFEVLCEMDHNQLREVGIEAFGDRHRILKVAERFALCAADGQVDQVPYPRFSSSFTSSVDDVIVL